MACVAKMILTAVSISYHTEASFLQAASLTLRIQLSKPTDRFQAYFLALFSDQEYRNVLECIATVDKAFKKGASSAASGRSSHSSRVVCFFCGSPGHVASSCFRRRQQGSRGRRGFDFRFSPYSRPSASSSGQRSNQGQNPGAP